MNIGLTVQDYLERGFSSIWRREWCLQSVT